MRQLSAILFEEGREVTVTNGHQSNGRSASEHAPAKRRANRPYARARALTANLTCEVGLPDLLAGVPV